MLVDAATASPLHTLQALRTSLYNIPDGARRKVVHAWVRQFEAVISANTLYLTAYVDLAVEVLSVAQLYRKPGMYSLLQMLHMDMDRMTAAQKDRLLQALRDHYSGYDDLDLCWRTGDLIARCYDEPVALAAFSAMFDSATAQGKEGVALGLDVLMRQPGRAPDLSGRVRRILGLPKVMPTS